MKAKSRVAMLMCVLMVMLMMPVVPSFIIRQETKQQSAAGNSSDTKESIAAYVTVNRDIVATGINFTAEQNVFQGKAVAVDSEYLNVYESASEEAELAGKMYEYNIGEVLERNENWTKISSGNLVGYVKTAALCFDEEAESVAKLETSIGIVPKGENVTVYASTTENAAVITELTEEDYAMPVSIVGSYIRVMLEDGSYGYISKEEAEIDYGFDTGLTIEEEEAIKAAEEEARRLAQEEERRRAEEEEVRRAAEEALRQQIIERTKSGTDFTYNPTIEISDDDLWVLACIIDWEAGWEPYEGKLAVANVVLNRVRSSHYPDTVQEVVYARGQFGGVMSGDSISSRFSERLKNGPRTDECMEAALEAVSGKNNVGDFTAFNGSDVIDYSSLTDYMVIDGHCFY